MPELVPMDLLIIYLLYAILRLRIRKLNYKHRELLVFSAGFYSFTMGYF